MKYAEFKKEFSNKLLENGFKKVDKVVCKYISDHNYYISLMIYKHRFANEVFVLLKIYLADLKGDDATLKYGHFDISYNYYDLDKMGSLRFNHIFKKNLKFIASISTYKDLIKYIDSNRSVLQLTMGNSLEYLGYKIEYVKKYDQSIDQYVNEGIIKRIDED